MNEENGKEVVELSPTDKRVFSLTWAFFWRWILISSAITATIALTTRALGEMPFFATMQIFLIAHGATFFWLFKRIISKEIDFGGGKLGFVKKN